MKKTAPTCKKKETCVSDQRDTVVISRATLPFTGHKKKKICIERVHRSLLSWNWRRSGSQRDSRSRLFLSPLLMILCNAPNQLRIVMLFLVVIWFWTCHYFCSHKKKGKTSPRKQMSFNEIDLLFLKIIDEMLHSSRSLKKIFRSRNWFESHENS